MIPTCPNCHGHGRIITIPEGFTPQVAAELARIALDRYDDGLIEDSDTGTLAAALADLIAECERRIDPERLEALTVHPAISIVPMHGVSMAGDRWIITGGGQRGRRVDYARTFPEALAIAESRR